MGVLRTKIQNLNLSSVLRLIFLFNIMDALLTLCWTQFGIADEANPFMAYMLSLGPIYFITIKIALVGAALWILWHLRDLFFARLMSILALFVMTAVLLYHAIGIHLVAG